MSETIHDETPGATANEAEVTPTETQATPPPAEAQKPAEPVVPEKYEFELPEGMPLDQAAADEFSAVAKELKLPQDAAKRLTNIAVAMQKRQIEQHQKDVEGWIEKLKADQEIGGEKLSESLGIARRGLETYGSQELYDILASTGFESHPAVVRAFYKIGKELGPDTFVAGSPPRTAPDPARTMFPNMK